MQHLILLLMAFLAIIGNGQQLPQPLIRPSPSTIMPTNLQWNDVGFNDANTLAKIIEKVRNNGGKINLSKVPELCMENRIANETEFCRKLHNETMVTNVRNQTMTARLNQTAAMEEKKINFKFEPKLVRQCKRFIFHPLCNMTIILNDIQLEERQVKVFQYWMDQYNRNIMHGIQSNEMESSNFNIDKKMLNKFEITRANRMLACIQNSYYVVDYALRPCLLNLIKDETKSLLQIKIVSKQMIVPNDTVKMNRNEPFLISLNPNKIRESIKQLGMNRNRNRLQLVPSSARIHHCRKRPIECPINITLFGLEMEQWQMDIIAQWIDEYIYLVKNDDDADEDYVDYGIGQPIDRNSRQYLMTRSFEMLACFREATTRTNSDHSLKTCLIDMLAQYGYLKSTH